MTSVPIPLQAWASAHSIPAAALADLLQIMGAGAPPCPPPDPSRTSEAYVQSLVRLEAPKYGVWLTRNNVGASKIVDPDTGQSRFMRFGLANETKQQNEVLKSGDLIGIRAVLIQPWHVGTTIGQFVSREVKHAEWKWSGDKHEQAQLAWAQLITRYGGDAQFVTGEGSFK